MNAFGIPSGARTSSRTEEWLRCQRHLNRRHLRHVPAYHVGDPAMIDVNYVRCMARYNAWQNQSIYGAAATLSDVERRRERGAFFGSIHKTLSHLLWADRIWMSRFTDVPSPGASIPESVSLYPDWELLWRERGEFDAVMRAGRIGSIHPGSTAISPGIRAPPSGQSRSRNGCSSRICSTIRPIIADKCTAW